MRTRHRHKTRYDDYVCKRCKMTVHPPIVHECDPSICPVCFGRATVWIGRDEDGEFVGQQVCAACDGTGKTIFRDKE